MEKIVSNSSDPMISRLNRIGGVSALVLGMSYIIITTLYALGGALTGGAEEWLTHLAGHTNEWWAILGFSVFTDFLFLPVAWSLYISLRGINQNAILAGVSFLVLFVVLDLAVTWPNYASLIRLSSKYAAAANDTQQMAVVAATYYPFEVLSSGLFGVYAILVPSLGILITGIVMLKGGFGLVTAYLGIVTGVSGIVAVIGPLFAPSFGMVAVVTSVFTLVWLLFVGCKLIRQSKPESASQGKNKYI